MSQCGCPANDRGNTVNAGTGRTRRVARCADPEALALNSHPAHQLRHQPACQSLHDPCRYRMAIALAGEPMPPTSGNGAAVKRNVYRPS
jgi:hypothetical protein